MLELHELGSHKRTPSVDSTLSVDGTPGRNPGVDSTLSVGRNPSVDSTQQWAPLR